QFGYTFCPAVFPAYVGNADMFWLTETLRILDVHQTHVRGAIRENLTVALCHTRFQANHATTAADKLHEALLHDKLVAAYSNANLKTFRDRHMFHLDYAETVASPGGRTGDI